MISAPIPANDAERLESLQALQILDTPPEERFDRIVRLLGLVMNAPIAYISLVDAERQWFKSSSGLEATETPRKISFCGHALLSDGPLIIPDAREDPRFADNPMVLGDPFIRFYAGQAISAPDGQKVGTLCVADRIPRQLDQGQIRILKDLARLVERELGLAEVVQLQKELLASQNYVLNELSQAARYIQSLLPAPLDEAMQISSRWTFYPSSQLGGDCFGYDWLDPDHFVFYLLDVSGHGVGASLLSISVANALRGRSLPDTDFRDPASVLTRLNQVFPMERQDDKYFTIWYGVFNRQTRTLTYASGGHPPALLLPGLTAQASDSVELEAGGFAIGMIDGAQFESGSVEIPPGSRLHLFSDGVYEVKKADGTMMSRSELRGFLASVPGPQHPDEVLRHIQEVGGSPSLADDFSLLSLHIQ